MADGYRSLLAPWIGGAANSAAAPPAATGYRSMLAPWIGGAANNPAAPPSTVIPDWIIRARRHCIR